MNKWILGARPRTLPAAIAPVLVATALAGSDWKPISALLALIVSLALQVGVNYANDYSDGIRGTDNNRVGPTRLTASGLATATSVRSAAIISFAVAGVAGFVLASTSSWWLLLIGALAIAAAWGYTGGNNPYGYMGLGEISVFLFFGVIATMGTYFVQSEQVTIESLIVSIPMGSLACAILAINNLRDRAQDELVGKKTLAVRLGERRARALFIALLICAYIFALATLRWGVTLTLLTLPIAASLITGVRREGASLIPLLAKTAKLQLVFAVLFSIGLVL
jgi:1,4-dihydroxy-2-naphthoate octaprenyltransferase